VLSAVLFDWGDTLMRFAWDDELLVAGHRAGLAAIGRGELEITERFRADYEPELWSPGRVEEVDYAGLVRRLLAGAGAAVSDGELDRFLDAEHRAWTPARQLAATTHALLDALRGRGLALGLVSNAFDPPWLLRRDLDELGVAERLDVAVFSSEVGRRKPDPAIFLRALDELGVEPGEALFVGDRLHEDVGGAAALGMTTVQALWFRADDRAGAVEPDFEAFTQMDVLNVAGRVAARH
jgi:putative hydrolase of the HAD superfamily